MRSYYSFRIYSRSHFLLILTGLPYVVAPCLPMLSLPFRLSEGKQCVLSILCHWQLLGNAWVLKYLFSWVSFNYFLKEKKYIYFSVASFSFFFFLFFLWGKTFVVEVLKRYLAQRPLGGTCEDYRFLDSPTKF